MLERSAAKVARCVLRGLGEGDLAWLPGAGLALGVALGQGLALADTINVNGTTCTLIDAITTANNDSNTGGCVQTPSSTAGADTIVLQQSSVHTLTAVDNSTFGDTGLPVINTEITIEGNDSTIQRGGGSPSFRILAVSSPGTLTLRNTTITGGKTAGLSSGGGIFNYNSTLTLEGCTVSGNTGYYGGGVYNHAKFAASTVILTNSTVSYNDAGLGGGVFSYAQNHYAYAVLTFTNSTFSHNVAGSGGGLYTRTYSAISAASKVTLTNSTLSGNTAYLGNGGGGMFNKTIFAGTSTLTLSNSTLSGNSAYHGNGAEACTIRLTAGQARSRSPTAPSRAIRPTRAMARACTIRLTAGQARSR